MRQTVALAELSDRRLATLVTGLLLVGIALSIVGVSIPLPHTQAAVPLPGVRATNGQVLVHADQISRGSGSGTGTGTGQGQAQLAFLAVEPDGTLLASDQGRNQVLHLDQLGTVLAAWGPNFGPGVTLGEPAGITATAQSILVVDRGATPRILYLDLSGQLQHTLPLDPYGTYGLNGLHLDAQGDLFLADTGRNRLLEFGPDGNMLREIGHGGSDLGSFAQPMDLAFAPDGSFYVADWDNSRIEHWSPYLEALNAWHTPFQPRSVAVDAQGRVYVPDGTHQRIQVYTPSGSLLSEIGAANPTIDLSSPDHLAFGPDGALFVLGDDGIEKLALQDTPPPPQETSGGSLDITLPVLGLVVVLLAAALVARVLVHAGRRTEAGATADA